MPTSARGGRHHVEIVMGMAVSIDVRDEISGEAIDDVVAWLHHVNGVFSTHDPDTPISAMGRGELSLADAGDEIREVLRLCEMVSEETNGCFDAFGIPAPNGTMLETSGLVKGWAIERAAAILESHGAANFCVNAGGDVALRGRPTPGAEGGDAEWQVGIRHPVLDQELALVIHAAGRLGVATSATYERGAHIYDPRLGQPTTGLASATVVGPDLTMADAYATAIFVMGLDALDWATDHPDYDLFLITHQDTTHWTEGFNRYRSKSS
ncbi:MAG: FAD:protein FMN transferase [Acidimicrobiales bacterium]